MPGDKKGREKHEIQNCFTPRSWGARSWREEPDDYAPPKEHAEHRNSGLCEYASHAILANLKKMKKKKKMNRTLYRRIYTPLLIRILIRIS